MNWEEFQVEKELYRKSWESLKASYEGDLRKFLNKSFLVVAFGAQFELNNDLIAVARECPNFFVKQGEALELLELAQELKSFEKSKSDNKKQLQNILDDVAVIKKKFVFSVEGWRVEPRFPTIDMDFIQTIKQSVYCDQTRTHMRAYSIGVVLKKG